MTGVRPKQATADQGYRGKKYHPNFLQVLLAGSAQRTKAMKRWLKRRSAIEPVIGHVKHDHGLARNYLLGHEGDGRRPVVDHRINAILAACGFNLRKLFHFVFWQNCSI